MRKIELLHILGGKEFFHQSYKARKYSKNRPYDKIERTVDSNQPSHQNTSQDSSTFERSGWVDFWIVLPIVLVNIRREIPTADSYLTRRNYNKNLSLQFELEARISCLGDLQASIYKPKIVVLHKILQLSQMEYSL